MLAMAVIFINLALVSYTISVWMEKRAGELKATHLVYFTFGLIFDMIGTSFMKQLATSPGLNLHGITGCLLSFSCFYTRPGLV